MQAASLTESQGDKFKNDAAPTSVAASALLQNTFSCFRFLYSSKSHVLSIHYLNMNPYQLQPANYRRIMQDCYSKLRDCTNEAIAAAEDCECSTTFNQMEGSPPVFLKRNLKQMQKLRDLQSLEAKTTNGLTVNVVP